MIIKNGMQLAEAIAVHRLGNELGKKAGGIVKDKFYRAFGKDSDLSKYTLPAYNAKLVDVIDACKKEGIPPNVAHSYFSILTDSAEMAFRKTRSGSQKKYLSFFVLSNSSEINVNHLLGGDSFGISMMARNEKHIKDINDYVPISYMLGHGNVAAAIISIGEKNAITTGSKTQEDLSVLRADKFISDARRSKHYVDGNYYYHVQENGNGGSAFVKIPIIAAIYDNDRRITYVVDRKTGPTDISLYEYFEARGLAGTDVRFSASINAQKEHMEDAAYSRVKEGNSEEKESGCVDLRATNKYKHTGKIKEIGSNFKPEMRKRIVVSQESIALEDECHTDCGYLNTLKAVQGANNEMRTSFGGKNPIFRKMIERSMDKIANDEVDVLFYHKDFKAAIEEFEGAKTISHSTVQFFEQLITGTANDLRKTLRHAYKREKVKIENGLVVFPAAQKVENVDNMMKKDAGRELTGRETDILLTEESARENYYEFQKILNDKNVIKQMVEARGSPEFFVTESVRDIHTGIKYSPPERLPQNVNEVNFEREFFYKDEKVNILQ